MVAQRATPYIYPPFLAILLMPFGQWSYDLLSRGWLTLNILAYLLAVAIILSELERSHRLTLRHRIAALSIALFLPATSITLYFGQTNILMLLSLVLCWWLARHRRDSWAGLALSFGIMIKLTPALLLPYFLWRGRWRLVATALVFASASLALSVAIVGLEPHLTYLLRVLPSGTAPIPDPADQSLAALFQRLLTENPFTEPIAVAPTLAPWGTALSIALVLALTVWAWQRPGPATLRATSISAWSSLRPCSSARARGSTTMCCFCCRCWSCSRLGAGSLGIGWWKL